MEPGKAKLHFPKAGKPIPEVPVSPAPGVACLGALAQASCKKKGRLEASGVGLFFPPAQRIIHYGNDLHRATRDSAALAIFPETSF